MKVEHEFWMEQSTKAVWAVELRDGVVTACCGPLMPEDVDEDLLGAFDYSVSGAPWIEWNRERFAVIRAGVPELPGM